MALSADDADLVLRVVRDRKLLERRLAPEKGEGPIALSSAEAMTLLVALRDLERRLRRSE